MNIFVVTPSESPYASVVPATYQYFRINSLGHVTGAIEAEHESEAIQMVKSMRNQVAPMLGMEVLQ